MYIYIGKYMMRQIFPFSQWKIHYIYMHIYIYIYRLVLFPRANPRFLIPKLMRFHTTPHIWLVQLISEWLQWLSGGLSWCLAFSFCVINHSWKSPSTISMISTAKVTHIIEKSDFQVLRFFFFNPIWYKIGFSIATFSKIDKSYFDDF